MNLFSFVLVGMVLTAGAVQAQTELDPQNSAPKEIIVRVDGNGKAEVFKVAVKNNVQDEASAALAVETFVTEANQVQNVVAESELDKSSSTEAWYYYYNPYFGYNNYYTYNYSYSYYYNYSYYNYSYRPYYYYNYGNYGYYYYRF